MRTTFLLSLLFFISRSTAQSLLVQPFLQDAEPTSIVIAWEASDPTAGLVEWGTTNALGSSVPSESEVGLANSRIHHAHIMGLQPDTRYYYKVKVGAAQSSTFDFVTPPLKNSEKSFALVAMSDMQQDGGNPTVYEEICNDGIIAYLNGDIPEELAFAMLPGDLVDNGPDYGSWKTTFFDPSQNLFRHVPVYPAIGNHEANTPTYFKYFQLPDNGTPGYEEHWWYKDYSNLRIIGLNSNGNYAIAAQLDWLETVLAEAAADPDIDFVFAQMHHPHHSELWPAGNSDYTGEVIKKMEAFTAASGKPSLHFYGHTHAYSRGQSQDYTHSMVNVATSGGNIDYWGEFPQTDYPEHNVSQDEYGFVWVDVQAGDAPQFLVKRISRGNENQALDNVLRDSFLIKRYNHQPATPIGTFPMEGMVLSPDCPLELTATPYTDTDGDLHGAAQWQVSADPNFGSTAVDVWKQYENWYNNVDLQTGDDLTNEEVEGLEENTTYYWRVRYRDRSLGWSEWSEPISFQTSEGITTENLLVNGGAEDMLTGWTTVTGVVESILSGDCAGNLAYAGERLFAVGGVCTESAYGEARQDVDVTDFAQQIAEGTVKAKFGGYLSDYQGSDRPEFRLDFLNASGDSITSTSTFGVNSGDWYLFRETADVPTNCAKIRFVLMGTREAGTDNDSYFDEMFLKLDTAGCIAIAPPTAAFTATPTIGCWPLTVQFTNESSDNATSWSWSFPGGIPSTSIAQHPTVVYQTAGVNAVILTATNAAGSATATEFNYITVQEAATVSFMVNTNGYAANFTNTSFGATSYTWNFGDGTPVSTANSPTHTYATDGSYTVTLTGTNTCGDVTSTQTVVIGTAPTADFTATPTIGCWPLTVQFTNESSANATSWNWSFPGGIPSTSIAQHPTVVYQTAGVNAVILTATNAVGSTTATEFNYITVQEAATVSFTVNTNIYVANFTNTSFGGTSYTWDFGDGSPVSTANNPTHIYATEGSYTVTLTGTNTCGDVTSTQTVTVSPLLPSAAFTADLTDGCAPLTVQFENQSSGNVDAYSWSFPGGTPATSTDENPTVVYNTPGTHTVTLTVSNATGPNTATQTDYITVGTAPTASFTGSVSGTTVTFSNTTTGATNYAWNFGDGSPLSTEANPTHTYITTTGGTYTVTLTATNACGTTVADGEFTIVTLPTAAFSASQTSGCVPFTVQFTNESSDNAATFLWSFPGGTPGSSTEENPVVTYNTPGTYAVALDVYNAAGYSTDTQTNLITVSTTPTAGFFGFQNDSTVIFENVSINATSYEWDYGDGSPISTVFSETHTFPNNGTYTVTLTAINECGEDTYTTTIEVLVIAPPVASFEAKGNIGCAPLTVTFHNLSENGVLYGWSFPGGTPEVSMEENPVVVYNTPGIYDVSLGVYNGQDVDVKHQLGFIVVSDVPSPSFTSTTSANVVTFTNTSTGATSFVWDFGDGSPNSTAANPTHTYSAGGVYEVTLMVANECGAKSTMVDITIVESATEDIPGIRRFEVFPNPTDGRFTLLLEGAPQTTLLDIGFANVLGQSLYQDTADFRTGSLTQAFSFGNLAAGVYILQVKSGERVMFKRVVVR